MPLHSIPKLSSQETEDPLKCNMCDFTAKWPAELQKHAVSHSDERPFVCMVCGSTYKWKWDLVKHFEKAHSNLPNPYKRRDAAALASSQSSNSELQANNNASAAAAASSSTSASQDGYEMEEGEIATPEIKIRSLNGEIRTLATLSHHQHQQRVDLSGSFLFDQGSPSQDDISVENILRTSQQAGLMMSRQPNFLDGPDEPPQPSSSATSSPRSESRGEGGGMQILDVRSLQGLAGDPQPGTSSGGSRPIRQALARNIRVRQNESGLPFPSQASRPKGLGKATKGSYKGYKTVEGSEASDLKYQCVLCDYKARWPSEIMQHMKNHSSEKPYGCPNCTYRSKWKWDVVKHLKRCGGGTIKDVIDYSQKAAQRDAPPNVMVTPDGGMVQSQQASSPVPGPSHHHHHHHPPGPSTSSGGSSEGQSQNHLSTTTPTSSSYVISIPSPATSYGAGSLPDEEAVNRFMAARRLMENSAPLSYARSPSPSPSQSSSQEEQQGGGPEHHQHQHQPQHHPPAVVFNSLINEGQHHCLHCTFVANSPAELRRHQVLHSEEKPFICDECNYSTKWKCDMKKHKEKYRHNGPIKVIRPNGDIHDADQHRPPPHSAHSAASSSSSSSAAPAGQDEQRCSYCSFETYTKEALQSHVRQSHPDQAPSPSSSASSSGKKSPSSSSSGAGRFRCKKCPFSTNELVDLINHRRLEHAPKESGEDGGGRGSPAGVNGANELDEARLKHPRKAMKKYACSRCSFVCLKSTELLEHHQRAHRYHYCPFCTKRFLDKNSFLDHLVVHPEFDSKEWELLYFEDNSDAEEDVNNNTNAPDDASSGSKITVGSTANTIDLTSSGNNASSSSPQQQQQQLRLPPLPPSTSEASSDQKLPCQWCDARFSNVVRLYQHSSNAHPHQMKEQEMAEGMGGKTTVPSPSSSSSSSSTSAHMQKLARGGGNRPGMVNGESHLPKALPPQQQQPKKGKRSPPLPARANGKLVGICPRPPQGPGSSSGTSLLHAPTLVAQLAHPQAQAAAAQLLQAQQPPRAGSGSGSSSSSAQLALNLSLRKAQVQATPPSSFPLLACNQCSFTARTPEDFLYHLAKHSAGEKVWAPTLTPTAAAVATAVASAKSQAALQQHEDELRCWFCGELQRSFVEVFQHMLELHPTQLNERSQQREALMQKVAQEVKPTKAAALHR